MILRLVHPKVRELLEVMGVNIQSAKVLGRVYRDVRAERTAHYCAMRDHIVVNLANPEMVKLIDVVVLHEIIHWSGNKGRCERKFLVNVLNRSLGLECDMNILRSMKDANTEEMIAQMGMLKLGRWLGLDEGYLKHGYEKFNEFILRADMIEAEKESDIAVKYLQGIMEKRNAA